MTDAQHVFSPSKADDLAPILSPDIYRAAREVPGGLGMLGCPFCSSDNVAWSHRRRGRFTGYQCQCNTCGIRQGGFLHNSVRGAVDAWNRRAAPTGAVLMPEQLPPAWVDQLPPVPTKKAERAGWLASMWSRLVELSKADAAP